jgi:HTH-type transcriptional regulator/antitoxin HigA
MATTLKKDGSMGSYLKLVKRFPLTSIHDDDHLTQAQKMIDSLLAREPLDDGEEAYLDALSDLIEVYESQTVHIGEPSDAAMLSYLMQMKPVSKSALAMDTGISKSTISEVIAGKRRLTRLHIAKLSKYFGVGQIAFSIADEHLVEGK